MPRAVLDSNVLVSALISPRGASAQLLLKLRDGAFELVVSPHLLAELGEVLKREKFRRYVSEDEVDAYVGLIRQEAVRVDDLPSGDLIDLAHEGRADWIVSGDIHLLGLSGVLRVKTPREFLDSLD